MSAVNIVMAAKGIKRRKLEHTPSDDDNAASFASFGASEEVAEPAGDAGPDKTLEGVDDGDERLGDEEREGWAIVRAMNKTWRVSEASSRSE